jgi:hypothetical protein
MSKQFSSVVFANSRIPAIRTIPQNRLAVIFRESSAARMSRIIEASPIARMRAVIAAYEEPRRASLAWAIEASEREREKGPLIMPRRKTNAAPEGRV